MKELLYRNSLIKLESQKKDVNIRALEKKIRQQEGVVSHTRVYFDKRETDFCIHEEGFLKAQKDLNSPIIEFPFTKSDRPYVPLKIK